jgi:hypothetical protein
VLALRSSVTQLTSDHDDVAVGIEDVLALPALMRTQEQQPN